MKFLCSSNNNNYRSAYKVGEATDEQIAKVTGKRVAADDQTNLGDDADDDDEKETEHFDE